MTRSGPRLYVLLVLTGLMALNHLDRQLTSILLEPIRHEFGLSDIALGLLSGAAFVVLFTVTSIPAAVWAVRHSRRNLVAAAAMLWGAMTIVTGLAQSTLQLFLGRLGVGIGESGSAAPSQAMISELYHPGERAAAQAVFSAGLNIGVFLAFLVGGVVGQIYGWRTAFVSAGMVTVLVGLLLRLSVRDPFRPPDSADPAPLATSRAVVQRTAQAMGRDPVLRQLCLAAAISATVGSGALAWLPSFLVRSHHLGIAFSGLYLALVIGIGGAIGGWLVGILADRLGRRDLRWSLWVVALVFAASKPLSIAFYLVDDTTAALLLFILPGMAASVIIGPSVAVLHDRIDAPLHPIASALLAMAMNLVGVALGPLLVGVMSQWLFAGSGEDSLRYALAALQVMGLWGATHYYLAGRRLARAAEA